MAEQSVPSDSAGKLNPFRLRDALRKARIEAADRTGVVVELRDAEVARLEILNEALDPLFAQVPDKVDLFFATAREIAADLAAKPIDIDELQRIKRPMAQRLLRMSSGNQFWMQRLGGAAYDPQRIEATKRLAEDFVSIGPADIQAVAQRFLRPDTDWTLKVVPRAK